MSNMLEFAAQLVRTPGESGSEGDVARLVKERLEALRFDEVWVDDAGNVVGLIKGRKRGEKRTLLFDAHMDTVGVEDADAWQQAPYGGEVFEGRLYGRGAVDMRGALAAMVYGLAGIDRELLSGQVYFSASVCEEVLEGAALREVLAAVEPGAVVIGEATSLRIAHAQRGRAELSLQLRGRSSHSAWPQHGHCAVSGMCRAWLALQSMAAPHHPLLGEGITVLTDILSTPYPGRSVVPFACTATLDRRLLPGEKIEEVIELLKREASAAAAMYVSLEVADGDCVSYTGWKLSGAKIFPAWELLREHPLVQSARTALRECGLPGELTTYGFCTNGSASAGELGIPTIGFGPGEEGDAHQADESVAIEELLAAERGYRALALGLSTRASRQISLLDL